jgi:hypothetical protein
VAEHPILEGETTPVLVLGPAGRTRHLAGYLLVLGYRSVPAEDLQGALKALASNPGIQVGLLASEHDLPDAAAVLAEIRDPARPRLTWALFGMRPAGDETPGLRAVGVQFLLADPFTDEELRFVLNEAHHADAPDTPRLDERVPASLRARVVTKTGERVAHVCNLSTTGAYLATPRPTLRGGIVELHLPLGEQELALHAQVVWNNVPGNLRRPHAPIGMGVHFIQVPEKAAAALRAFLDERIRVYRL